MKSAAALPQDPAAKREYLERAFSHGQALQPWLAIGAPLRPLLDYVASNSDLSASRAGAGLVIRFGELVTWEVALDGTDHIEGTGFSGYEDLMIALGIDFSGRPYVGN